MHVVPDAGAVGGGIIIAENGNALTLAERHLQDQGDQVCFRAMRLAATGHGTGRVEVSQHRDPKAVDVGIPLDSLPDLCLVAP